MEYLPSYTITEMYLGATPTRQNTRPLCASPLPPQTQTMVMHATTVKHHLSNTPSSAPPSTSPPRPLTSAPPGASRLMQALSARSGKTRHAPSRQCRDARVCGHTTTAMHHTENNGNRSIVIRLRPCTT